MGIGVIKHLSLQSGYIIGTNLTASYQTVLSLTDDVDTLHVFNTCDKPIYLYFSTQIDAIFLPERASFALDARANAKKVEKGLIRVKHAGVTPTAGYLSLLVTR